MDALVPQQPMIVAVLIAPVSGDDSYWQPLSQVFAQQAPQRLAIGRIGSGVHRTGDQITVAVETGVRFAAVEALLLLLELWLLVFQFVAALDATAGAAIAGMLPLAPPALVLTYVHMRARMVTVYGLNRAKDDACLQARLMRSCSSCSEAITLSDRQTSMLLDNELISRYNQDDVLAICLHRSR